MAKASETLVDVDPKAIKKNPNNPRRYFNDEALDALRTSIQEVGILVPLIAFEDPGQSGFYVLMDGERRWTSALELGLDSVPVNLISPPSPLQNLLRMFNIHAVREDWPLISTALSLREVIRLSGETRESRLAEVTGLTRGTVRRAKRLLTLPDAELQRISDEAHLDREKQIHREDLYLEIQAAESVIRNEFPEIASSFPMDVVIRQFARKREEGVLTAVTDFRDISKVMKAVRQEDVDRKAAVKALTRLIRNVKVTPSQVIDELGATVFEQQSLSRRVEHLSAALRRLESSSSLSRPLVEAFQLLRSEIDRFIRGR